MLKHAPVFSSFSVNDLQEAKHFYKDILELDVSESYPGTLELNLANNINIFIYPKADHIPAIYTILNFKMASTLEEAVEYLANRGVRFEIYKEPNLTTDDKGIFRGEGPKIAWFKDPAGNIISVVEKM